MSRDVCGICWCPYDDDGRCGCKGKTIRHQLTDLEQKALADLKREVEASNAMLEELNTANALLLEATGLLMQMPIKHPQQGEHRDELIKRIGEHIK
jgi:flagellar hook-associated protein FlgK